MRTRAPLNFEVKSSYSVIVTATDPAGASHGIIVTITVNNVEEPGTVTLSSLQPIVALPLTATLDDPDEVSGSVTWSWERSQNGTSSWTLISGETAATYSPDAADEGRFLRATASYDDVESAGKSARAVSVNPVRTLKPDNALPQFPQSETRARSVTENTPADTDIGAAFAATDADSGDTLTYSLGGSDAASFDINKDTGQLQTKAALDFETTPSYSLTVTATDTASGTGTITVSITVNNLEEAGTVTLSSTQPQVIFQLTATLDDPDVVNLGSVTWSWESSPNRNSLWTIISGKTSATYTPVAADVNHYLRATASYTDEQGPGKRAEGVSANVVQAAPVTPNEPPAFVESLAATRNVNENTPAEGNIGAPVAATDPENETLTYSLDVTSRASFDIVATTGQLRTKSRPGLRGQEQLHRDRHRHGPGRPGRHHHGHHHRQQPRRTRHGHPVFAAASGRIPADRHAGRSRQREWQRDLVVAEFSEQELPWDPHQWGNLSHLHAGCRRCGRLPAGHCLLHRWRRIRARAPKGSRPIGWRQRPCRRMSRPSSRPTPRAQRAREHAGRHGHRRSRRGHRRR